ncbi:MAG: Zn-dependent alcohol dehydrogenase [Myxococcota bacterium]
MKAAVLREVGGPFRIEDVELDAPGPREVRVRTVASGVCGSDLHVLLGENPWAMPIVLGHEPAGIVEAVGRDVRSVAPGDAIVACSSAYCGQCDFCSEGRTFLCGGMATLRAEDEPPRLRSGSETVQQFAYLSSFAEAMLLHENSVVRISREMPLDRACLLGCGVLTGVGAALNTANVRAGETAAVIGCGGVGLSVVQGCRIAGAGRIIAIDTVPWKLELAKKLGATDVVLATEGAVPERVIEATRGGVDWSFECIGHDATVQDGIRMLRAGGTCLLIGLMPAGRAFSFPGFDLVLGAKRVMGSLMGSNRFRIDIPKLVGFYLAGRLDLDTMISERIRLEELDAAFARMQQGTVARSVVVFD